MANQQDKMDREIKAMLTGQEAKVNQQVKDMLASQQDKMDREIGAMLASQETKISQQVQHMLDDQRKAISAIVNAQQKVLLSQQFSAPQIDKQKKTNQ